MKKIKKIISIFAVFLIAISCEEDVNIKSEFIEKPVVYAMIDAESNHHKVILERNFSSKDDSNIDYFIEEAHVNLLSNNDIALLSLSYGDGVNSPFKFYSTDNFIPNKGVNLSLNIDLPNGKSISSEILPPSFTLFLFEQEYIKIPLQSDDFSNNSAKVSWILKTKNENLAFRTYFFIDYYFVENTVRINKRVEIPIAYVTQGNKAYPIYPEISQQPQIRYYQNDVEKTLFEISQGDTTGYYTIYNASFELYIMEENLAKYLSTTEAFKNQFSIKVYEPEVGNIDGGLGIFGAYIKRTLPVIINENYLKSLGFSTDLPKEE